MNPTIGTIAWTDLTVPDAAKLKDFYRAVVGWRPEPVEMGGYKDFTMLTPESGEQAAGVCHARGQNASIPPVWLVYIAVADLDASIAQCERLGGRVIAGPHALGTGRFCVIQDPAKAVCALYQAAQ